MNSEDENRGVSNFAEQCILATKSLPEHRLALVGDLNRMLGPPSDAMAILQHEFINDYMDAFETIAFASSVTIF